MRSELILIAALSVVAFLAGDISVGCLLQAGDAQADMLGLILAQVASGSIIYIDALPLSVGAACACAVWLVWVRWWERRGRYRKGEEHGSARWSA